MLLQSEANTLILFNQKEYQDPSASDTAKSKEAFGSPAVRPSAEESFGGFEGVWVPAFFVRVPFGRDLSLIGDAARIVLKAWLGVEELRAICGSKAGAQNGLPW